MSKLRFTDFQKVKKVNHHNHHHHHHDHHHHHQNHHITSSPYHQITPPHGCDGLRAASRNCQTGTGHGQGGGCPKEEFVGQKAALAREKADIEEKWKAVNRAEARAEGSRRRTLRI